MHSRKRILTPSLVGPVAALKSFRILITSWIHNVVVWILGAGNGGNMKGCAWHVVSGTCFMWSPVQPQMQIPLACCSLFCLAPVFLLDGGAGRGGAGCNKWSCCYTSPCTYVCCMYICWWKVLLQRSPPTNVADRMGLRNSFMSFNKWISRNVSKHKL